MVVDIDSMMCDREEALKLLKESLVKSQNRMKQVAHKHRTERSFEVVEKVGMAAYRLDLPPEAGIHPTFHVSLLKQAKGPAVNVIPIPSAPRFSLYPVAVVDTRVVKRRNKAAAQVLVIWKNKPPSEASWEFTDEFKLRFPDFVW
ncbi:hypothetical protein E3N88_23987 [Mikania micrantha]|uniref:Tf2-1-like SH3-like domain-containing protein n=1 Tax=Mikania micrantha TaxID=192012 RepID=A0A5N6NES9_9ASTR|nr:hypothetical protein E3N88_23987 [Mikania micrantha]